MDDASPTALHAVNLEAQGRPHDLHGLACLSLRRAAGSGNPARYEKQAGMTGESKRRHCVTSKTRAHCREARAELPCKVDDTYIISPRKHQRKPYGNALTAARNWSMDMPSAPLTSFFRPTGLATSKCERMRSVSKVGILSRNQPSVLISVASCSGVNL